MASVMGASLAPRYGSAADLAAYSGLSVKTIRRLVDAGRVRGRKVGRRLLIPYEDLDAMVLRIQDHGSPTTMQATLSQPSVDARGRAIPLDPDRARARAAEALRALEDLDAMGDEDEQRSTFAALAAGIDQDRPSDRPRFRP